MTDSSEAGALRSEAQHDVRIFADLDELTAAARVEFEERARRATARGGRFTVALSGGSTPERLYRSLAGADLDWTRIHFFFGDERHVGPEHQDSNYRMVDESLFAQIGITPENVHRIQAELDAEVAARLYEAELRAFFGLQDRRFPRFDVALMGMGADGHTASLFPGSDALLERERLVVAPWIEKLASHRITLTISVFEEAASLVFLVAGKDKAPALKQILSTPPGESDLPAGHVRVQDGELIWMVDRNAAGDRG